METTIVKVQRPISTNASIPLALIYDENRDIYFQLPYGKKLQKLFDEDEFKVYMSAEVTDEALMLLEKMPEQSW